MNFFGKGMRFLNASIEFKDQWIIYMLLIFIPLILYFSLSSKRKGTIKFSAVNKLKRLKPGWKFRLRFLPVILRIIAVILLVLAVARPRKGNEIKKQVTQGIAIQMVIDKSGSMKETMNYNNLKMTRIEVVKEVFKQFVDGMIGKGKGRDNDLIGITSYSGIVEFNCPLTLDHSNFDNFLEHINVFDAEKFVQQFGNSFSQSEVAPAREYLSATQMTAIGDALYYSTLKLIEADKYFNRKESGDFKIKNKIMILLTDGQHNYGRTEPVEGAELAAANNIKVYTIGIGSKRGGHYIDDPIFGRMLTNLNQEGVDEDTLKMIAKKTGGKFYFAEDGEQLQDIYKQIDKLEKTQIEDFSYLEYNELFRIFLFPGLAVLIIEIILSTTIFRRIP